jgi:translation elongation factor EF-G
MIILISHVAIYSYPEGQQQKPAEKQVMRLPGKYSEVHYRYKKQDGGPGQFAELRMKFELLESGQGIEFVNSIIAGAVPKEFSPSVETGIRHSSDCPRNNI